MWTKFWDMHSGGGIKVWQMPDGTFLDNPYKPPEGAVGKTQILIEAPENEAKVIFYNLFGHNPDRVTCTCCGEDYSIDSNKSLRELTGYQRNCAYGKKGYLERQSLALQKYVYGSWVQYLKKYPESKYMTLKKYLTMPHVLVIYAKDIKPEHRVVELPTQGWVWQD